jgi:hypothetical protein
MPSSSFSIKYIIKFSAKVKSTDQDLGEDERVKGGGWRLEGRGWRWTLRSLGAFFEGNWISRTVSYLPMAMGIIRCLFG